MSIKPVNVEPKVMAVRLFAPVKVSMALPVFLKVPAPVTVVFEVLREVLVVLASKIAPSAIAMLELLNIPIFVACNVPA